MIVIALCISIAVAFIAYVITNDASLGVLIGLVAGIIVFFIGFALLIVLVSWLISLGFREKYYMDDIVYQLPVTRLFMKYGYKDDVFCESEPSSSCYRLRNKEHIVIINIRILPPSNSQTKDSLVTVEFLGNSGRRWTLKQNDENDNLEDMKEIEDYLKKLEIKDSKRHVQQTGIE